MADEKRDVQEFKEWWVREGYIFSKDPTVTPAMETSWMESRRTLRNRLKEERNETD